MQKGKRFSIHSLDTKVTIMQLSNLLKTLPDYVSGEEKTLVCKSLNISLKDLVLLKQFSSSQLKILKHVTKKRLKGIPLNKILKRSDFYLDEFFINKFVLAPRKETEILVEKVLEIVSASNKNLQILDLCCGSGVIGLSVLKHAKIKPEITLLDKSLLALRVAKKNAKMLKLTEVQFMKSNMFSHLKKHKSFDIIACNPPYICSREICSLQAGVKNYDPKLALDGGSDGLKFYKIIAEKSQEFLNKDGVIVLEIGYNQADDVSNLLKQNGFNNIEVLKDYSDNDRIVIAKF